jgi:hypothetical protein
LATPIVDDTGRTVGGVVVFRDVKEQCQLENRLAQSERLAAIGTPCRRGWHTLSEVCVAPTLALPKRRARTLGTCRAGDSRHESLHARWCSLNGQGIAEGRHSSS